MPDSSLDLQDNSAIDNTAILDRAMNWLRIDGRNARRLKWAFFLCVCAYFGCLATLKTAPMTYYGHDIFLLLDGGWRIVNGQVPYRDFYLALGPLEYMNVAVGMLLTHSSPLSIEIGNVVFGIVIGIWGWLVARQRMLLVPALMVTAWLILMATCPTPISLNSSVLSYAMIYNRHGYALLGIVLVECAFASDKSRFTGGLSSGIALILLAFLKLNFFGGAFMMLLVTVPLKREEMPRLCGLLTGIFCALAAFACYLRFAIFAFLSDMRIAIQARSHKLDLSGAFGDEVAGRGETLSLLVLTMIVLLLIAPGKLRKASTVRVFLLGVMVIASGPLFVRSNCDETGCQLATLWAIILIALLVKAYSVAREKIAISALVVLSVAGTVALFFQEAESVRSLIHSQTSAMRATGWSVTGDGMERLKFYDVVGNKTDFRYDNGRLLVDHVNDGLELLQRSSTQDETVLPLGFQNPFSYILRRKPALGGSPWLICGDNIPVNQLFDPSSVFGNADLIMTAHYPNSNQKSDARLNDYYHSYLEQHFTFVASSQWWTLYRRNK